MLYISGCKFSFFYEDLSQVICQRHLRQRQKWVPVTTAWHREKWVPVTTAWHREKWVPVTTAWRVVGLRMEEQPPDIEGSWESIEQALADSRQVVILQLECWAKY
jgi:hypothetical protein